MGPKRRRFESAITYPSDSLFKMTSFWFLIALNDVVLFCILKNNNKQRNDVVLSSTETKRCRFIFYRDETTSFYQGSNAQKKELVPCSNFPGGGGGGGGGWAPNAGTSDGDRRLRFWSDERAAGRRTATAKRACLSPEEILDFDFRSSDNG